MGNKRLRTLSTDVVDAITEMVEGKDVHLVIGCITNLPMPYLCSMAGVSTELSGERAATWQDAVLKLYVEYKEWE